MIRSGDENVGGSVVVIFWVLDVGGKPYCVRFADENVGVSMVDVLFVILKSFKITAPWLKYSGYRK